MDLVIIGSFMIVLLLFQVGNGSNWTLKMGIKNEYDRTSSLENSIRHIIQKCRSLGNKYPFEILNGC